MKLDSGAKLCIQRGLPHSSLNTMIISGVGGVNGIRDLHGKA